MLNDGWYVKSIFGVSVLGALFSGYLTFSELFSGICNVGGYLRVVGVPSCMFGFLMFVFIAIVSGLLWYKHKDEKDYKKDEEEDVGGAGNA